MSAQRDEIRVVAPLPLKPTPEQVAERKRYIVTQYDRGILHDRLQVDLPDDVYGEWTRKDGFEIDAMVAKGFTRGDEYVKARALHHDGATPGIADVVFMVTPKWNKELLDQVRAEKYVEQYGKKGEAIKREDRDFAAAARAAGIKPTLNSSESSIGTSDIVNIIAEVDSQTP
jgi:hypothetical protein